MTITDLSSFLQKKCPEIFQNLAITQLSGKRVAIDTNNIAYIKMSGALKKCLTKIDPFSEQIDEAELLKEWIVRMLEYAENLLTYGVYPVFIFDGPYDKSKSQAHARRKKGRDSLRNKIEELYKKGVEMDELERPDSLIKELRKKLSQKVHVPKDFYEGLWSVYTTIGIPCLHATSDAEKLCAMLCHDGLVEGVITTDSDVMAYEVPLMIKAIDGATFDQVRKEVVPSLSVVYAGNIHARLELNQESYIDMCIMCQCDHNSRIRGCGIKRSYDLLKECGRIENLPEKYADKIEVLNHLECREILSRSPSASNCQEEFSPDLLKIRVLNSEQMVEAMEFAEFYSIMELYNHILELYEEMPPLEIGKVVGKFKIVEEVNGFLEDDMGKGKGKDNKKEKSSKNKEKKKSNKKDKKDKKKKKAVVKLENNENDRDLDWLLTENH